MLLKGTLDPLLDPSEQVMSRYEMVWAPMPFVHPLTGVIPSHGTRYPLRGGLRRV